MTADNKGCFGLTSAHLVVDPSADLVALLNDCNYLLDSAIDAAEELSESVAAAAPSKTLGNSWWAMLYTLRQARILFGAVYERGHELQRCVGREVAP